MRLSSRIAVYLGRTLPRGHGRVLKFAAKNDPDLWDLPLPLSHIPSAVIHADLREPVYTCFLRNACIPHQIAQDALYLTLLDEGDVIFDVGANVGYLAMLFAYASGPNGHVYAFEPGQRIYPQLVRNTKQFANIRIYNVGASDKDGEALFFEAEFSDISSMLPIACAKSYTVKTISLDNFATQQDAHPSFIKIDVEGNEERVLQGACNLLGCERAPIVVFEALTSEARQRCTQVFNAANSTYSIFRIQTDASLLPLETERGTADYIAVPNWAVERVQNAVTSARMRIK
jgi:FkbM family methyltransferase